MIGCYAFRSHSGNLAILTASPVVFGYADTGTLRYWHFVLGIAVVLLAVLELRQDWNLSRGELTHHSAR
jgi:hypothetical protein